MKLIKYKATNSKKTLSTGVQTSKREKKIRDLVQNFVQRFSDLNNGVRIILHYFDYFFGELEGRKTIFEFF